MIWDLHCHLGGFAGRTPDERISNLINFADRMGIERVCVFMGYPFLNEPTPAQMREQNDQVLQAISHWHNRAFGFVYLSPQHLDFSLQEFDRCVKNGPMVGIKLWVAKRAAALELDPIIRAAASMNAVIFQHTWHKTTGNLPGESEPADLAELASRHPKVPIILGHTGGEWETGIRTVRHLPNVSADIAGFDPTAGAVEMAVRELGAARVIYGSDAGGRSFASQLGKVMSADISERDRQLILGENLKRMMMPILRAQGNTAVIVDTNVTLGLWPFRRVPGDTAAGLIARLKRLNVSQAWTGSFDGVFHRDLTSANARLAKACEAAGGGLLLPFGSINPKAAGWREDLRRCHEVHRMPGIRLHPNYHGYTLGDTGFADILQEARDRKLIVQLVLALEDERTQHPLMRTPPVDPAPLARVVQKIPDLRLVVLNRLRTPSGDTLLELARSGEVYFDLAMIEGTGCAGELVSLVSAKRVVFGSHTPFQYFDSALLKIKESAITGEQRLAILNGNAKRLLDSHRPAAERL